MLIFQTMSGLFEILRRTTSLVRVFFVRHSQLAADALRGSFFWVPHLGYSQVMPHCLLFTPPSPLEPGHRPCSTILLRNSAILPISTILKNRELHCQKTDIQTCFQK